MTHIFRLIRLIKFVVLSVMARMTFVNFNKAKALMKPEAILK